jgi:hypothetical protein
VALSHRSFLIALLSFLPVGMSPTWGGNAHEHAQLIPKPEHLFQALEEMGGWRQFPMPYQNRPIHDLFGPGVAKWLGKIIQMSSGPATLEDMIFAIGGSQTLAKVESMSEEEILKRLLGKFEGGVPTTSSLAGNFSMRNLLFEMSPELYLRSLRLALLDYSPTMLREMVITFPYSEKWFEMIPEIRKMILESGGSPRFLVGIRRGSFAESLQPEFSKLMERAQKLQVAGTIDGIDISGSLLESSAPGRFSSSLLQDRLRNLLLDTPKASTLRIHAFEGAREGGFYQSLWRAFEAAAKVNQLPSEIRIGHILHLDPEDIRRFSSLRSKTRWVFEANVESNTLLHDTKAYSKLSKTITRLHQAGFPVAIGSDGIGVLGPGATFEAQLVKLRDAGLSSSSLQKLIDEAYRPETLKNLSSQVREEWIRERLALEKQYELPSKLTSTRLPSGKECLHSFAGMVRRVLRR